MNNDIEKDFNLGGSVERALSGDYELKAGDVFKEAWGYTIKNFLSFSPAIIALLFVQLGIFYIALKLQLGNPGMILDALTNPEAFDSRIVEAIFVANFSYEVVSAPIYAGVSLMAMSHAAGLQTKPRHIAKGLQFTIPVILATLFSLMLQGIAGMILPFLSMYLSLAFSNSILLICEKRIPPMQSLLLSLRAVNKKILVLAGIYLMVTLMFVVAAMFYGIGLIFVVPFFFHVKGIVYRNMFGIKLKIVASDQSNDDDQNNNNKSSQVFDA
ncbi:hypothetical protein [Vibrio paucivorans]|uniref:Proline and glycine rich transmembrane protein gene in bax n=1 Tax=Vibrio paucivorans TaxID=2829489 RepID=A0A9X3HSW1_9VIBR|nr:hypothetical protein [Vibrio paucivorans]MCW8335158.1 hypothetical protein [Vibrio paucivorans]